MNGKEDPPADSSAMRMPNLHFGERNALSEPEMKLCFYNKERKLTNVNHIHSCQFNETHGSLSNFCEDVTASCSRFVRSR